MSKTYWLHCESGKEAERLPAPLTDAAGRQDYQTASASNTPLTFEHGGLMFTEVPAWSKK